MSLLPLMSSSITLRRAIFVTALAKTFYFSFLHFSLLILPPHVTCFLSLPLKKQWFPFPSLMCISMVSQGFADNSSCAEPWAEGKREAVETKVSLSHCFEESGSQRLYGNSAKCAPLPSCPGASCPDRLGSIPWKCCSSGDYIPDASQSLLSAAALHFAVASWVLSSMNVKLSGGRSLLWKLKENEAPSVYRRNVSQKTERI